VLAVRYFGGRGAVVAFVTLGLAAGAVYGGFHYVVDVIAGALLGVLTALAGLRLMRSSGDQANAIAPT
jgi:membrane-associated phospholipid phosphatase